MRKANLKKLAAAMVFCAGVFLPAAAFAEGDLQQGGDPGQTPFDGKAYFVWECNNGKACYHLFEDLKTPDQGINEIEYTKITDQSSNGANYVFKQKNADWVLPSEFATITSNNYEDYIGDEDKGTHGVTIQAIAFGGGNNSIATNEDWNFQVIIYRAGYKAVMVGDNPDDYTYFPSRWDFNYNYNIDISDTSATNPAVINTYLKEPTIKLKVKGIISVTPIGVNSSAVTVSPSLEGFDLTFNSSYYDHVVFELKSSDGKTYYLRVDRISLEVYDSIKPNANAELLVGVMYPFGKANGDTYSLIATTVKADGSKSIKTMGSGSFYYRVDTDEKVDNPSRTIECGKNLACSWYAVKLDNPRALAGVYLNVIKNGSSDTVYSGTFSGSNKGTYWDAKTRKVTNE